MLKLQESTVPVRSVAYSADGRWLAAGYDRIDGNGLAVVWEMPVGRKASSFKHKRESVEAVAFSPAGGSLAVGLSGGHIKLVQPGKKSRAKGTLAHDGGVGCLAFSPDGTRLASGGWDRSVLLTTVPKLLRTGARPKEGEPVRGVVFITDGDTVVAAGTGGSLFWIDVKSLRSRRTVRASGGLFALAASPGGDLLATGDAAGTITLWQAATGQARLGWRGHDWTVYGLAFTPDGRTVISGSADGTVRLWDVESGREVQCFRWHQSWVTCVAAAPDGMTAAAGSNDGSVVVWDLA